VLDGRIAHPEGAPSLAQSYGSPRGVEGTDDVTESVLPELRHLDPRVDGNRPRSLSEVEPRGDRVRVPA
jgi:hypothetical protein